MIDNQILFDKTLNDLEEKNKTNDEYELLMATPLLRKLLIDGDNSLISQINKKGKKLRFRVNVRDPLHKRLPSIFNSSDLKSYKWFALDGFDPATADTSRSFNPIELTYDEFLKQVVICANGEEITVRDLIKHLSDKEGGVHKQRRELEKHEIRNLVLHELGESLGIGSLPSVLSSLRAINRVVIRSLAIFKS